MATISSQNEHQQESAGTRLRLEKSSFFISSALIGFLKRCIVNIYFYKEHYDGQMVERAYPRI